MKEENINLNENQAAQLVLENISYANMNAGKVCLKEVNTHRTMIREKLKKFLSFSELLLIQELEEKTNMNLLILNKDALKVFTNIYLNMNKEEQIKIYNLIITYGKFVIKSAEFCKYKPDTYLKLIELFYDFPLQMRFFYKKLKTINNKCNGKKYKEININNDIELDKFIKLIYNILMKNKNRYFFNNDLFCRLILRKLDDLKLRLEISSITKNDSDIDHVSKINSNHAQIDFKHPFKVYLEEYSGNELRNKQPEIVNSLSTLYLKNYKHSPELEDKLHKSLFDKLNNDQSFYILKIRINNKEDIAGFLCFSNIDSLNLEEEDWNIVFLESVNMNPKYQSLHLARTLLLETISKEFKKLNNRKMTNNRKRNKKTNGNVSDSMEDSNLVLVPDNETYIVGYIESNKINPQNLYLNVFDFKLDGMPIAIDLSNSENIDNVLRLNKISLSYTDFRKSFDFDCIYQENGDN